LAGCIIGIFGILIITGIQWHLSASVHRYLTNDSRQPCFGVDPGDILIFEIELLQGRSGFSSDRYDFLVQRWRENATHLLTSGVGADVKRLASELIALMRDHINLFYSVKMNIDQANRELKELDAKIAELNSRFEPMLPVTAERTERLEVDNEHPESPSHPEISVILNLLNRKLINIQNLFLTAASEKYTEKNKQIKSQLTLSERSVKSPNHLLAAFQDDKRLSLLLEESASVDRLEASLFNQWTKNRKLRDRLESNSAVLRKKACAILRQPISTPAKNDRRLEYTGIMIAISGVLFLLIFSYLMFRSMVPPLEAAADLIHDVAEGEGDLTQQIPIKTKDEIGKLMQAINLFIRKLQQIFHAIAKSSEVLSISSANYHDFASTMSDGAHRLTEISNTVASAAEQMSMNVHNMASATEEMSENVSTVSSAADQLAQNIGLLTAAMEESEVELRLISENAQKGSAVSTQAVETVQRTAETMNTLGLSARKIGKVTAVIRRIAERTNLLALNATIEAASAGPAGRSFAVVAKEIKLLAERSAQAADDIAQRIGRVQQNTAIAVTEIDHVKNTITQADKTNSQITAAVTRQTSTISNISENIRQAETAVNSVATAVSEVARGIDDISENVSEAANGASDTAQNIHRIYTAAQDTSTDAQRLDMLSGELARAAGELQTQVARFKLQPSEGGRQATKKECMDKCRQAAMMIKEKGLTYTLDRMNDPQGPFVWKDSYVYCYDYSKGIKLVAHPISSKFLGQCLSGFKDINGKLFVAEYAHLIKTRKQGWTNFMCPKPGETTPSLKINFVYKVPQRKIFVGAGIYRS